MQRVSPVEDLVYTNLSNGRTWNIPAGTPVSMTAKLIHTSEDVWGEDANEFRPERWLSEEGKGLGRWLLSFSKGSRMCLGYVDLIFSYSLLAGFQRLNILT